MYSIQNNTPSAGYIQWTDVHIQYNGNSYTITNGYTNYRYVYWLVSTPTQFVVSDTFPVLSSADVLVFLNKSGIAMVVPSATILDGGMIVPGSIYAAAIAANTITGNEIAAGAISASELAANSVVAGTIAANAVTAGTVAANAIGAEAIAAGAITADKIVASTITGDKIAMATITANKLVAGTITAASGIIADAAITTAKIADAAIQSAKIASLDAGKITTGILQSADGKTYFNLGTAEIKQTTTIGGKTVSIKINPTDGLAFFDGTTKKGGLEIVNGKLTMTSDVLKTSDKPFSFVQYEPIIVIDGEQSYLNFYTSNNILPEESVKHMVLGGWAAADGDGATASDLWACCYPYVHSSLTVGAGEFPEDDNSCAFTFYHGGTATDGQYISHYVINATSTDGSVVKQFPSYWQFLTDGGGTSVLKLEDTESLFSSKLLIQRNVSNPVFNTAHLELRSTDGSDVALGFHRSGYTACALIHEQEGLKLVSTDHTSVTNFQAGNIYSGENFYATAIWGKGMYVLDETNGRQWHIHMHGDSLKYYSAAYGLEYEVIDTRNKDWYTPACGTGQNNVTISGLNIHSDFGTGFYMGNNVSNAYNSNWWYFLINRHNVVYKTVTCWPLDGSGYVWWKRCTNGSWTSWMRINA